MAESGGWQNLKTLQTIYQEADMETMRSVVMETEKVALEQV